MLTGGRAFCGVGAGWWAREHAAFGLPFPAAAERVQRLEATLETMRALWNAGTKAYHGAQVSLPETTCYPRPVGPLPLIVGGKGQRVLSIAARLADACNVPSDLDSVSRAVAAMGDREVTVLDIPVMGRDREQVATLVERLRGRQPAADYAQRHHAATVPDHVDPLPGAGAARSTHGVPRAARPRRPGRGQASRRCGRRIPMNAVGDASIVAARRCTGSPRGLPRHLSG